MNFKEIKELLPILEAIAAGKTIQHNAKSNKGSPDGWIDISEDAIFPLVDMDYRVKPEPREFWLRINDNQQIVGYGWIEGNDPLPIAGGIKKETIRVREVLDD